MELLFMQFSPASYYLTSLISKYSSQHPVLKHHHSTFLPQCQTTSFTPIQNTKQNYRFVYFNLYIFRQHYQALTEFNLVLIS
jgi:hypothetical protein